MHTTHKITAELEVESVTRKPVTANGKTDSSCRTVLIKADGQQHWAYIREPGESESDEWRPFGAIVGRFPLSLHFFEHFSDVGLIPNVGAKVVVTIEWE